MGVLIPVRLKNNEWHPTKVITVNRTSGVAPLTIFFDAESLGEDYSDNPFHDIEYRWNFGDTANATAKWEYGARPNEILKNETTGPVSAHVYEEAGTYNVEVTVWDGSASAVYTVTQSITVEDPDVVFVNTTTVVSTDGDFTDAPDGSTQITSSDFDTALASALGSGSRRVLFKAGQTFSFSSQTTIAEEGPVLIGSFGTGSKPIMYATDGVTLLQINSDDVRVMDIEVAGNSFESPNAGFVKSYEDALTILRVYTHDVGFLMSGSCTNLAIVDSESGTIMGSSGNVAIYAQDVFGLYIAGCLIDNNNGGEHCIRYQGGTNGVITSNTIKRCNDTKQLLTIRGDYTQTTYITEKHVVSDNYFDSSTSTGIGFPTGAHPQNNTVNEEIRDVIFERNYFNACEDMGGFIFLTSSYVTVRNNLMDSSNSGIFTCVYITYKANTSELVTPTNVSVYNNTIYTDSTNGITGVYIGNNGEAVENTTVKNNFMYAPNSVKSGENNAGPNMVTDYSTIGTIVSSNTLNASDSSEINTAFTHFTVQPPTGDPNDWVLVSGSYGVSRGESVHIWSDYFNTALISSSTRNLGAIHY